LIGFKNNINIKNIFEAYKSLKQVFKIAKDKYDPILGQGVSQIPYSCGKSYIGQTRRSFKAHLKEHVIDTKTIPISKSTIFEHSQNYKHLILFEILSLLLLLSYNSGSTIN
jgi:hypothetical protein